jgi:hypothetical protein
MGAFDAVMNLCVLRRVGEFFISSVVNWLIGWLGSWLVS